MPQLFVPYAQRSTPYVRVVVRGSHAATEARAIRAAVQTVDPRLPISDVTPLADVITTSLARTRFYTALLALFAGVGLALAATGVFGVMSYAVSQRAQETGIRLALGAAPVAVLRLVVRQSLGLTATGLVAGLLGAVLLPRGDPPATLRRDAPRSGDLGHRRGNPHRDRHRPQPRPGPPRRPPRSGQVDEGGVRSGMRSCLMPHAS